jgi:hypothetical protein
MTEEQIALAKRAVACKGWRWMDGMRALDGDGACGFRLTENSGLPGHPAPVVDDAWLPDLTDPATLGCLLALVREAWEDHTIVAKADPEEDMWYVVTRLGAAWSETEAASLVAALEAAP